MGAALESKPVEALLPPGADFAGKFRIVSFLAEGGMGQIYRAEQVSLRRDVALKVLHPKNTDAATTEVQLRFLREAETCAKLTHPNTVRIYDYGRTETERGEMLFIAMELLAGETLAQTLRRFGALDESRALRIARDIARSLREAHRHHIVHRDLKPGNVMLVPVDEQGELVKVLDFGIAKVLDENSLELTREGKFLGSPRYMSPEQIDRDGVVDERADLYSLGVILFQMLTGRPPFESERTQELLVAHLTRKPPTLAESGKREYGAPLEEIVWTLLAKSPLARYQTADELIRAIDAVLGEVSQSIPVGPVVDAGRPDGGSSTTARSRPAPAPPDPDTAVVTPTNAPRVTTGSNPEISAERPIAARVDTTNASLEAVGLGSRKGGRGVAMIVAAVALAIVAALFWRRSDAPRRIGGPPVSPGPVAARREPALPAAPVQPPPDPLAPPESPVVTSAPVGSEDGPLVAPHGPDSADPERAQTKRPPRRPEPIDIRTER